MADGNAQGVQGSFIWHEVYAGDPKVAQAFYTDLLGWGAKDMDMGGGNTYTLFTNNGEDHGGYMPTQDGSPAQWLVYLGVDDVDGTCSKAVDLGGTVLTPPMDIPVGRMAIIQDPAGATFAVFCPKG